MDKKKNSFTVKDWFIALGHIALIALGIAFFWFMIVVLNTQETWVVKTHSGLSDTITSTI